MLPKFSFLVKLENQPPEPITVTANDCRVAAYTAGLAAQFRLGCKMNLGECAPNRVEQIQLLGFQ